jgi:hypothetical protein
MFDGTRTFVKKTQQQPLQHNAAKLNPQQPYAS